MTHNQKEYVPSEEKRIDNTSHDAMKRLVAQVDSMSSRIGAVR